MSCCRINHLQPTVLQRERPPWVLDWSHQSQRRAVSPGPVSCLSAVWDGWSRWHADALCTTGLSTEQWLRHCCLSVSNFPPICYKTRWCSWYTLYRTTAWLVGFNTVVASVVAQWAKPLLGTPAFHRGILVQVLHTLVLIQQLERWCKPGQSLGCLALAWPSTSCSRMKQQINSLFLLFSVSPTVLAALPFKYIDVF